MDRKYGLVIGQGRSGTNWLLDCLDASSQTFCRNEPNECIPSLMDPLPNHWRIGADGARLAHWWDQVAHETATHMGERDHRLNHPKDFVRPLSQQLGIAQLSARPKARRLASRVLWSWADGEWAMPRWVGRLDQPDTMAIFKLVQAYNWATWVIDNRPDVPVVQVVRHPGGRHESFLRRYVATADAEKVRKHKIDQLRQLAPEKGLVERMGPLDALTLEEAETWFGVYQMEVFEHRAARSPKYLRVVYEDMVSDPSTTIEQVFDHLGLRLSQEVQDRIDARSKTSVFGQVRDASVQIDGWRDELAPDVLSRIEAIMDKTAISAWWQNDIADQQAA